MIRVVADDRLTIRISYSDDSITLKCFFQYFPTVSKVVLDSCYAFDEEGLKNNVQEVLMAILRNKKTSRKVASYEDGISWSKELFKSILDDMIYLFISEKAYSNMGGASD